MSNDPYRETFLKAEEQATILAGELERLAKALRSYDAVANSLSETASGLASLTDEQRHAVEGLDTLTREVSRLGGGEFLQRLDAVKAALASLDQSVRNVQATLTERLEQVQATVAHVGDVVGRLGTRVTAALLVSLAGFVALTVLLIYR